MTNAVRSDRVFPLPGGLVEEDGRRLGAAELRPLTGHQEAWLAEHAGAPSALAVTRLLSSCVVRLDDVAPGPEVIRRLLVGDRDFLMLQLRRITLGDRVLAVLTCPACGAKMDVEFLASEVPIERRLQTAAT